MHWLWQHQALPLQRTAPEDQVPPGPSRSSATFMPISCKRTLQTLCYFCVAVDAIDSFSEQLFCKRNCSLKSGLEITNGGCAPSHSQEGKQRGLFCCATFNKHAALFRAFKRKQRSSSCHPVKNVRLQSCLVLHMIGSILLNCCK